MSTGGGAKRSLWLAAADRVLLAPTGVVPGDGVHDEALLENLEIKTLNWPAHSPKVIPIERLWTAKIIE